MCPPEGAHRATRSRTVGGAFHPLRPGRLSSIRPLVAHPTVHPPPSGRSFAPPPAPLLPQHGALHGPPLPTAAAQVEHREQQRDQIVEVVGGPAERHVGAQHEREPERIGHIEEDGRQDDAQRHARVARSRDGELPDEGRHAEHVGREHHPERGDAVGDQPRIVRIEAQHPFGEEGDEERQRHDEREAEARHAAAERAHLLRMTRADEVAHQRAGRRGEGVDEEEDHRADAADHVRHGQLVGPQPLDADEEEEPAEEGHPLLEHHPDRDAQDVAQQAEVHTAEAEEAVAAPVEAQPRVEEEEEDRDRLGGHRSDGGTGDAQLGETAAAENQQVVEHDVRQHHHHRVGRKNPRAGRPHVEGAEHRRGEGEEEAPDAPVEVVDGGAAYRLLLDEQREEPLGAEAREGEEQGGEQQQEERPLHEDGADFVQPPLAVAAGDEHLRPDAEAEAQHEDHQIEDTGQRRGGQLGAPVAVVAQVDGVGQPHELLHEEAYQHRKGDFQYVAVRVALHGYRGFGVGCGDKKSDRKFGRLIGSG